MERLTERDEFGNANIIGVDSEDLQLNLDFDGLNKVTDALNKLARYEDLEDQGLIPKLKVGDTVYFISERTEKKGRRKVVTEFVDKGIVDNITLGSTMVPQITVCNDENIWTTFDSAEDFGKTVFLTQAEAEEALKGMERQVAK